MAEVVAETELRIDGRAASLARELAASRGTEIAEAVIEALQEAVAWQRGKAERVEDIMRIGAEVRATLVPPLPSSDHSWLYDEDGLTA